MGFLILNGQPVHTSELWQDTMKIRQIHYQKTKGEKTRCGRRPSKVETQPKIRNVTCSTCLGLTEKDASRPRKK